MQASRQPPLIRLDLDVRLGRLEGDEAPNMGPSPAFQPRYHAPEEEIALGPACWLWDYLRRSHSSGFFLPLSGGIDSCATAIIVHSMCREVIKAISEGNEEVIRDARRISGESEDSTWVPSSPQELCKYVLWPVPSLCLPLLTVISRIFHTSYMGTQNSSKETRDRSKKLAEQIGSYHVDFNFDSIITAVISMFGAVTNFHPKFKVHGGSWAENIALQNVQARLRMVLAYLYASLLPTVRQRPGGGSLLVLGSSNVDEWYGVPEFRVCSRFHFANLA